MANAFKAQANTAFSDAQEYKKTLYYLNLAAEFDPASQTEIAQLSFIFGQQYDEEGNSEAASAAFDLANKLDPSLQPVP